MATEIDAAGEGEVGPAAEWPRGEWLTAIELENFQSFRTRQRIEISRLTLLCGPNSVGKSALIDALKLVRSWGASSSFNSGLAENVTDGGSDRSVIRVEFNSRIPGEWPFSELSIGANNAGGYLDIPNALRNKRVSNWSLAGITCISVEFVFSAKGIYELVVEMNGDRVVHLATGKTIHLSPYLTVPSIPDSFNAEIIYGSDNDWRLHTFDSLCEGVALKAGHPLTQMILDEYKPSTELERVLVNERGGLLFIRGYDFGKGVVFKTGDLAYLHDFADVHSLTDNQIREWLSSFSDLDNEQKDPKAFRDFWARQATREALANSRRAGDQIARRINIFISSVLQKAASVCQPIHVKSDRTRIDSGKPFYICGLPDHDDYGGFDEEGDEAYGPEQEFEQYYSAGINRFEGSGARSAISDYWSSNDPLQTFAERFRFNLVYYPDGHPADYVQEVFRTCLPSLGSYFPIADFYQLQPPRSQEPNAFLGSRAGDAIAFIKLADKSRGRSVSFDEVGSGLSYVLPVISAMAQVGLRIIEQPELHLHPEAQAEVCDAMIAAAPAPTIIETHSDVMIARLARRIRESNDRAETTQENVVSFPDPRDLKITSDEVRMYFFERTNMEGAIIHRIELDREGAWNNQISPGFLMEEPVFERLVRLKNAVRPQDCVAEWPWVTQLPNNEFRDGFCEFWYSRKTWLRDAAFVQAGRLVEGLFDEFIVREFVGTCPIEALKSRAASKDNAAVKLEKRVSGNGSKKLSPGELGSILESDKAFSSGVRTAFMNFWNKKSGFGYEETLDIAARLKSLGNFRNSGAHWKRQLDSPSGEEPIADIDALFGLLVLGNAPGILLQRWYPRIMDLGGPRTL